MKTIMTHAALAAENTAPVIENLDGDVTWSAGTDGVYLDAGELAQVTDDGAFKSLDIHLKDGAPDEKTVFGIDTNNTGLYLSDGLYEGSVVSYHDSNDTAVEFGTISSTTEGLSGLKIDFNPDATPELVSMLISYVSFTRTDAELHDPIPVEVTLTDAGDLSTTANVTIKANTAPTDVMLDGDVVAENATTGTVVGTLSAEDPSPDETFTYTLVDDANGRFSLDGDKLVVADDQHFDYEQSWYHEIVVQVTDSEGLSLQKHLYVHVDNVVGETDYGSDGSDVIYGDSGNDWVSGGYGDDDLYGGYGNDALYGGWGFDDLWGGYGNDVLWGDFGDDVLWGGAGNDRLSGGDGADDLYGDAGNDVIDGGSGNDDLDGGVGNDKLSGSTGNDTLCGGLGRDVLTGGKGKDKFVFDMKLSKKNMDTIKDFASKSDKIMLDNKYMKKLGKGTDKHPGKLKKDFFTIGHHAKDKNDYLIYDNKKGVLYYDADGSGHHKAVEIANLNHKKLAYSDILVI